MNEVMEFINLDDYAAAMNLEMEIKFPDFLVYDYEQMNPEACNQLTAFRQNYFELTLELTQSCTSLIDQFELPETRNQLLLISPHRLQAFKSNLESTAEEIHKNCKGFGIFFKPEFIGSILENRRFLNDFPFFSHLNAPFISLKNQDVDFYSDIIQKILSEYQNNDIYSRDIIRKYLDILLMKARQLYPESGSIPQNVVPSREWEIYGEFCELVQHHFLEIKSVQEYAERIHLSPKHLSETIKKVSGKSALEVIHQTQVNHARALLRQTHKTVSEIAFDLSFDNPEYFSVFFKRLTGESPSEFRASYL